MANIVIESVVFAGLLPIKGRSRTTSQISKKEAEAGDFVMTREDGHTLRIESPLAVQLIPWAQVKSAIVSPVQPEAEAEPSPKAQARGR